MNFSPITAAAASMPFTLPDISPWLIKGSGGMGESVTLRLGDLHVWLLLGGGPLLVVAALVLVKVMYSRVRFFAMEFGEGGFFGRLKAIFPTFVLGVVLMAVGAGAAWLGWQAQGYAVTLDAQGLLETRRDGSFRFTWDDAESASERVKSTSFWISFSKEGRVCRARFQQRHIGEVLQDRAIDLTETGLIRSKARRVAD